MKRGPRTAADTAYTLRRVAEVNAQTRVTRPKEAGQMVKQRCPKCQSNMVEADWIVVLGRLVCNCICCAWEW